MTRSVLAVMAGMLCMLAGMRHASSLHAEERRLRRWGTILQRLAVLMQGQAAPLPDALCQAADSVLEPDALVRSVAAQVRNDPTVQLGEAFMLQCPDCPEQDALGRMFTAIGHGPLPQRLLALTQGQEEIALLASQAQVRAEKDAKLFQTLGWTGGLCLTILLL